MKNKGIFKLVMLSLFSAIGVILMSVIQFEWPLFPYLNVEISDFVVIFTFLLFGFKEASIVAVLKTAIDLLFNMDKGGAIPVVGHLTSLIASFAYIIVLWLLNKLIKKENFGFKILKYSLAVLIVSIFMTLANYTILTPLFLEADFKFFGIGLNEGSLGVLSDYSGTKNFFLSMVIIMLPFNLVKGVLIMFTVISVGEIILKFYREKLQPNNSNKEKERKTTVTQSESKEMSLDDIFKQQ